MTAVSFQVHGGGGFSFRDGDEQDGEVTSVAFMSLIDFSAAGAASAGLLMDVLILPVAH